MARVTGPLLSFGASGSVGDAITFATWKGRPYVRQLVTPSNPKTDGQTAQRAMQKFLSQAWKDIAGVDQATFDALASASAYSPFNAYTSFNLKRWSDFLAPSQTSTIPAAGTNPVLGTFAPVGASGSISISQPVTTLNAGWGLAIFVNATSLFTPAKSDTKVILPFDGTTTITGNIVNIPAGTWFVVAQAFKTTGAKGTLSAEVSVTVT